MSGCRATGTVLRTVALRCVVLALLSPSAGAAAQGPTIAALRTGLHRAVPTDTAPVIVVSAGAPGWRAGSALLGTALGLFAGAALATQLLPQSQCGDDPGLCEAIQGAAIGSVIGATLGASAPRGTGACGFGARATRGLFGSVVGYAFGFVVAGDPLSGVLLGGPLGAVFGSTFGASRCMARGVALDPASAVVRDRMEADMRAQARAVRERLGDTFYVLGLSADSTGTLRQHAARHWPSLQAPPDEWADSVVVELIDRRASFRAAAYFVDVVRPPDGARADRLAAVFHFETATGTCVQTRTSYAVDRNGEVAWGEVSHEPCRRRVWPGARAKR